MNVAARCAALLARCFPDGGAWSEADIEATLARPGGQMFENEGGFLVINAVLDEAEIWTIATDPDKRRHGFAIDLLKRAKAELAQKGISRLFLEVAEGNHAARALYQRQGFVECGRRRGYYRHSDGRREDAILMQLELQA